jgi:hypothetical protein
MPLADVMVSAPLLMRRLARKTRESNMRSQRTMNVLLGQQEYLLIEKKSGCVYEVNKDPMFKNASLLTYRGRISRRKFEKIKKETANGK